MGGLIVLIWQIIASDDGVPMMLMHVEHDDADGGDNYGYGEYDDAGGDDHGGDDEHECTDCGDNCDDDVEEKFACDAWSEGT